MKFSNHIRLLAPFSFLYALVTDIRNWMFDKGWLPQRQFAIPVINVGNLAVGGTGKTPHTLWIVRQLLQTGHHPVILSRGYGRATQGFQSASPNATAKDIGDEPLELYNQLQGAVRVTVCEDRCSGIEQLLSLYPETDVVVLDDAYQHRYVHPTLNLLLTDYHRLYTEDCVLPMGRLRERTKGASRADVVIVTKCPDGLSAGSCDEMTERLSVYSHQEVLFSTIEYAPLPADISGRNILVVTGIAHPRPLLEHLQQHAPRSIRHLCYRDHHTFSRKDVEHIEREAAGTDYIITTRKDFSRLSACNLSPETRTRLMVQDIRVRFLHDGAQRLQQKLSNLS